uniref:Uncharacterized protein n=1 Tax=Haptolina brevifila TaxID=156173 RepID=A0A7S2HBI7_9EUKA
MSAPDGVLKLGNTWSPSRQLGFSIFFQTPTDAVIDKTDKLNAVLMSLAFWLFLATSTAAGCLYKDEYYNDGQLSPSFPTLVRVFSIALIANGTLSLFPTGYCILICNIFKAKVIANQVWNVPLVMASIVFYSMSFEGYAFMMWAIGWSVAMFTVTARGSYLDHLHPKLACVPLAYIAAVAFVLVTLALASVENMVDAASTGFYASFAAACWFFGFITWSSMEGWAHVHQFGLYPDKRVWQFKGPQTMKIPLEKEVPGAWKGDVASDISAATSMH